MKVRITPVVLAFATCFSLSAVSASADEAAEAFLKSWIGSIDASADWRATYATVASDEASDTTTMSGLEVASVRPGFTLKIDTIAVTGFIPTDDETFAASAIRIEGGEIGATEAFRLHINSAEFRDVSFPSASGFAWDDERPYVAMIKALFPITKIEMSSGRIASLVLFQKVEGVESRIAYEQVNIDGWANGAIAAIGAGPIRSESPYVDQLTAMTIASAESRDINLDTFFAVYDPDRYVGGVGDGVWRQMIGKITYRNMIAAIPGVTWKMKEATLEDLRMRQLRSGIGMLANLGAPGAPDPSENLDESLKLLELLTAHAFKAFTMRDIEVTAPGVDRFSLAGLSITDFSSDVLGEFALDRLAVAVEDQGAVSIRRFAFGDLVPPALDAVIAAIKAQEDDDEVDVPSLLPTLGFFEAAGVDVAITDRPRTTLERFRLDLRDYVGPIPTTVSLELVDADVDAALIEDEAARNMLDDLGYDRVILDATLRAHWTGGGEIGFDRYEFAMKDVGSISGDLTLTGLLPTEYPELVDEEVLEKLSFVRGTVTARDDSIVGRGLSLQAQQLGVDPEAFREQFAMGLPFMLTFLGDPQLQFELAPVLQQFIKTAGGSITMVASPPSPQNLMMLTMLGMDSPFELVKALRVAFSGIPGVAPPPASAPAPEAAPADEPSSGGGTQFDPAPEPEVEEIVPEEAEEVPDSGTQFDQKHEPAEKPAEGGTQFD